MTNAVENSGNWSSVEDLLNHLKKTEDKLSEINRPDMRSGYSYSSESTNTEIINRRRKAEILRRTEIIRKSFTSIREEIESINEMEPKPLNELSDLLTILSTLCPC